MLHRDLKAMVLSEKSAVNPRQSLQAMPQKISIKVQTGSAPESNPFRRSLLFLKRRIWLVAVVSVALPAILTVLAATNTFNGTVTSGNAPTGWSTGATPASTDALLVNSSSLASGATG